MLILRNRAVALIWTGQLLSQAGTRLYQLALAWWLVSRGGLDAGKTIGLFLAAGALPPLLFVKPIGAWVDRRDSVRTLMASDVFSFMVVCFVALAMQFDKTNLLFLCVMGFLLALSQAFFDPALNKAVAAAAAKEDLEEAVALQSSTQSLASFGGAMAGALLIDRLGITALTWLNAASFLVSALCNGALYKNRGMQKASAGSIAGQRGPGAGREGWAMLEGHNLIKKSLLGFGLANFFMTPILVILPLYVGRSLGSGAGVLAGLEAGLWLGILCGTAASKWCHFSENIPKLGSACLLLMGLCLFVPGLIMDRFLHAALLFIAGGALGINNVKFVAMFQRQVPEEFKGRFFALMQAVLSFTFPAAYFAFGFLADWLSPPAACLIQGAGVMLLSLYFLILARKEGGAASLGAIYERA
ncbi:MAG: MFS transporter [Elusimicrobia bacterium]|nr:MFS transporter [Elusimicrobiota bacterium]